MNHIIQGPTARLLTALLVFFVTSVQAQPWIPVGPLSSISDGEAEYTSIAIDKHGTPYIAFTDNAHGYGVTVMKFNGSSWVYVGMPGLTTSAHYVSIAIDTAGTPYVAFQDHGWAWHVSVIKYNGSTWELVGDRGFSFYEAYKISLALDPAGMPYVAYMNGNGSMASATVMRFDGSSWQYVGGSVLVNYISDLSVAIGSDGIPYVALSYSDGSGGNGPALVFKFSGSVWSSTTSSPFISPGNVGPPSIDVAPDGTPYTAYFDYNAGQTLVKKLSGTSWTNVDSLGIQFAGSDHVIIRVSTDGTPYLMYAWNNVVGVSKYDGSTWHVVGDTMVCDSMFLYCSFALSPGGTPYVVFADFRDSSKAAVRRPAFAATVTPTPHNLDDQLTIFPQPNDGRFSLKIATKQTEDVPIAIFNGMGQVITAQLISSNIEVPIQLDLPPGIYFVAVQTSTAKTVGRLIIQH